MAGMAAAFSGYKAYHSVKSSVTGFRNMQATKIADPKINPHLNPFADTADLNATMDKQFGGFGKSLYCMLKHKITGKI
ncbi:hypothetical protein [Marinibactrum halimedae]|uniref:Uncharacterized protein n=1 Tax=Marinibactrum halimedae TaxID=1444977 RepID=A0AA37T6E1_9GAMM|nr:hypothetical protein [Marinibactrum halimedae]MCD9458574.1 hypothetical protein [Marinibactrum halimedae]GLS26559.1 hypothetical protein GCM10007877_22750 [Marinibactrum halimedae]